MNLTQITQYPVKSCAGIELAHGQLDRFGLLGDRRWMVVNDDGRFLSQREVPQLALVSASGDSSGISLGYRGSRIEVSFPTGESRDKRVRIWDDQVPARDAGDAVAGWLSQQLEISCRLVYMPLDSVRLVDGLYATEGETVSFADGFPLLLISQASLDNLNTRLPTPVPMNRFRPNLVVSGCEPFAEDEWRRIRIGAMEFDVAKACSRCVIPSIVQETASRDPTINRVLASFRKISGQIYFGQNLLYQNTGELRLGDTVEILA